MGAIELRDELVLGQFCQHCKFHSNRPATCGKHKVYRARKEQPCVDFKVKSSLSNTVWCKTGTVVTKK